MRTRKWLCRTASASRVKRLQYKPLHNLYLFRRWIWYLRDQVRQREGPLRARWNWRGTLSNWDTNATGLRNITPSRGWLAQRIRRETRQENNQGKGSQGGSLSRSFLDLWRSANLHSA